MPSKIIVDKQRSSDRVSASGASNAEAIARTMIARLSAFLPVGVEAGVSEKVLAAIIEATSARLSAASSLMGTADEAYFLEQADDIEPRSLRDRAVQSLYQSIVDTREATQGAFGLREVAGFGFSSATPRDPIQLSRFAGEILAAFEKKKEKMPPTKPGLSFEPKALLENIKTQKTTLDEIHKTVLTEERELQSALHEKNRTLDAYDTTFAETANLLEGLFLFVGMRELAGKVRPSSRQPGQTAEDEAAPLYGAQPNP